MYPAISSNISIAAALSRVVSSMTTCCLLKFTVFMAVLLNPTAFLIIVISFCDVMGAFCCILEVLEDLAHRQLTQDLIDKCSVDATYC